MPREAHYHAARKHSAEPGEDDNRPTVWLFSVKGISAVGGSSAPPLSVRAISRSSDRANRQIIWLARGKLAAWGQCTPPSSSPLGGNRYVKFA